MKKIELLCFYECADAKCRYDNLTIYEYNNADMFDNQTKHFVGTYCGTNVPHPMTLKDNVMIIFKTDFLYTYSGFEIQYAVESKKIIQIFNF